MVNVRPGSSRRLFLLEDEAPSLSVVKTNATCLPAVVRVPLQSRFYRKKRREKKKKKRAR